MKSECLPYLQAQQRDQISHYYRSANEENLPYVPIDQNVTEQLYENIIQNSTMLQVQLQANELLMSSSSPKFWILNRQKIQV